MAFVDIWLKVSMVVAMLCSFVDHYSTIYDDDDRTVVLSMVGKTFLSVVVRWVLV
jgi:hypothetical protein